MISKKYRKSFIVGLCIMILSCMSTNVYALSLDNGELKDSNDKHISEEVFDGYEGLETTLRGTVGFNYVFTTPDKNKELLVGFDPKLTQESSVNNSIYQIGMGWYIKLPFLDIANKDLYQGNGYKYTVVKNQSGHIVKYPGESYLVETDDGFCFKKADGSKEFYSKDGRIRKTIDESGNETIYMFSSGKLSKIMYSDESFISFNRNSSRIELKYTVNENTTVLATLFLQLNENENLILDNIKYNDSNLKFTYRMIGSKYYLSKVSVHGKYDKEIIYNNSNARVKSIKTTYNDGVVGNREYYYDGQGRISKMIDQGFAEEYYKYTQKNDGNFEIETTTIVDKNKSVKKETLNKYGQLIRYEENDNVLTLNYNSNNKVLQEKENDKVINYSYNPQGKVTLVTFPDGKTIKYSYYSNGQVKKKSTSEQTINYNINGEIQSIKSKDQILFRKNDSNVDMSTMPKTLASGISVLYNINSSVGVTNYHTYYGLSQSGFNCYSFALGKVNSIYNPGYFSGRSLNLNSVTGIKTNVEKDVESLGMSIYNSNVSATIPTHCWKIALRIKSGVDYHFMEKGINAPWRFKAGKTGPVMQLLNGKNPSNVTWDIYKKSGSKYVVNKSGFYNSTIYYMKIRD